MKVSNTWGFVLKVMIFSYKSIKYKRICPKRSYFKQNHWFIAIFSQNSYLIHMWFLIYYWYLISFIWVKCQICGLLPIFLHILVKSSSFRYQIARYVKHSKRRVFSMSFLELFSHLDIPQKVIDFGFFSMLGFKIFKKGLKLKT